MTLLKLLPLAVASLFVTAPAQAQPMPAAPPPLQALPSLDIATYMGTWYQVAWIPNRFQNAMLYLTYPRLVVILGSTEASRS